MCLIKAGTAAKGKKTAPWGRLEHNEAQLPKEKYLRRRRVPTPLTKMMEPPVRLWRQIMDELLQQEDPTTTFEASASEPLSLLFAA